MSAFRTLSACPVSDVCRMDPTLQKCLHVVDGADAFTVAFSSGDGRTYRRWAKYLCADCYSEAAWTDRWLDGTH